MPKKKIGSYLMPLISSAAGADESCAGGDQAQRFGGESYEFSFHNLVLFLMS